MATVNKYSLLNEEAITEVTLTATDDATIDLNKSSALIVKNATGGDLTLNITSSNVTSIDVSGVGTIDLSGGKDFTLTDGTTQKIPLIPTYSEWIKGDSGLIALSGGTGATAYIIEA